MTGHLSGIKGSRQFRTSYLIRTLLLAFVCLLMLPPLAAKPKEEEQTLVIPDFESAKEQYAFAMLYQRKQVISPDKKRRDIQLAKIVECHEAVLRNFPNDPTYTPLSALAIADAMTGRQDFKGAIARYEQIQKIYPENDYVQARAMYSIARCDDSLGQFESAKQLYRKIMDSYTNSENSGIREIASKSKALYYQVRDKNPLKAKVTPGSKGPLDP
ncbi:MAG: tetratricopeptide repeat protein [Candidatus Sumerlaeaceae bacterium]|nr:tetratricopeptide repeat protein [Candidatus Sumerlaeaceae bacterium]